MEAPPDPSRPQPDDSFIRSSLRPEQPQVQHGTAAPAAPERRQGVYISGPAGSVWIPAEPASAAARAALPAVPQQQAEPKQQHKQKAEGRPNSCWVCLRSASKAEALVRDCGCTAEGEGWAHLSCLISTAEDDFLAGFSKEDAKRWRECPVCRQFYGGEVRLGLARARWERVRVHPPEDDERLFSADRFASALQFCSNDQPQSLRLFKETLALNRQSLGSEHEDTLTSMHNLACLHRDMNNLDAAVALAQEAARTRRRILGKKHPLTLGSVGLLSLTNFEAGNFREALPLAQEALAAKTLTTGNAHRDTLVSRGNLIAIQRSAANHIARAGHGSFHGKLH